MYKIKQKAQYDTFEKQIINALDFVPNEKRNGTDAWDQFGNEVEIKTVSTKYLTTARDFSFKKLADYRNRIFIVGAMKWNNYGALYIDQCFFVSPRSLKPVWDKLEEKLLRKKKIASIQYNIILAMYNEGKLDKDDLVEAKYSYQQTLRMNNPKISMKDYVFTSPEMTIDLKNSYYTLLNQHCSELCKNV